MKVTPVRTAIFRKGDHLSRFIRTHIPQLKEGSVLVVSSKIVSLSEGRVEPHKNVRTREELLRKESEFVIEGKRDWITLTGGMLMHAAGIDKSNSVDDSYILLPKDAYASAKKLRAALMKHYNLSSLGIIISDSRGLPLRGGVVGVALGYAGIKGIRDYRGKEDLFGRRFSHEQVNVADSLASAAMVSMGEGSEQTPLALIEGAYVEFSNTTDTAELRKDIAHDIYLPFLSKIPKKLLKK